MSEFELLAHNEHLKVRLKNWVNERKFWWPPSLKVFGEWNARRAIRDDIIRDLHDPINEKAVLERTQPLLASLTKFMGGEITREIVIADNKSDYKVRLEKQPGFWSIGEYTIDNQVMSLASIHDNGMTSLSLDFPDLTEAVNPNIHGSIKLPTATVKTFSLLAGLMIRQSGGLPTSVQKSP